MTASQHDISQHIFNYFNNIIDITNTNTSVRKITDVRHLYFYFMYKYSGFTKMKIATDMKNSWDHTMVQYAEKKINGRMSVDKKYRAEVERHDELLSKELTNLQPDNK